MYKGVIEQYEYPREVKASSIKLFKERTLTLPYRTRHIYNL